MLSKGNISLANYKELFGEAARLREAAEKQDEALANLRVLREFALENNLMDEVVRSFLEEALLWQHRYMSTKSAEFLAQMEKAIDSADEQMKKGDLKRWQSRLARFRGRIADYQGKYAEAVRFYDEAIADVVLDPDYVGNPAMDLEYKGFKVIDIIRLGNVDKGIAEAKSLYEEYTFSDAGRDLKIKDYSTWAIWRSGLAINLCGALLEIDKEKYKEEVRDWLSKAERVLQPEEGVPVWTNFSFRKKEIEELKARI